MQNSATTRALFWNIWGCRHPEKLLSFLDTCVPDTDILCLTEVTDMEWEHSKQPLCHTSQNVGEPPSQLNGLDMIEGYLDDIGGIYCSSYAPTNRDTWTCVRSNDVFTNVGFGSLLLYRHDIQILAVGHKKICAEIKGFRHRVLQWVTYRKGDEVCLISHIHGIWIKENTKGDHPIRMQQSLEVLAAIKDLSDEFRVDKVVFGGDLNLDITTDALNLLSDNQCHHGGPFRNLIAEFGITDTRTTEYRHYHQSTASKYADYAFVCSKVVVHEFAVRNDITASDHAPLLIEFS